MTKRFEEVESKLSLQDSIKSQTISDRSKIDDLVSIAQSTLSIPDLQSSLDDANNMLQSLNTNIATLNELVTYSRKTRKSLADIYTLRNIKKKAEEFDTFRTTIYTTTEKVQMLQERIDKEEVDPKLQDYHKQIVKDAEEKVGKIYEKLQELEEKRDGEDDKINYVNSIIEESPPKTASYDTLIQLIELIQEIQVGGEFTVEPLQEIDQWIDKIIESMNEIDHDQESDVGKKKLKDLKVNADKLLQSLKFIKSVFDSTDGYTSTEEEDKTYDAISHNLNVLILELKGTIDKVKAYKDLGNFDDVDSFKDKILEEIDNIEQALEKHKDVLENIDWDAKLGRRKNELYEAEQEIDAIIEDGKSVLSDIKKIYDKATKNPNDNQDLIEKFGSYIDKVEENMASLENQKAEFISINNIITEFEDALIIHDINDLKKIAKMMKKNKEIKESIHKCLDRIDSLDAEIDVIAEDRNANIKLAKKQYKAKKGDEVDELLAKLINNSNSDVEIKRTGDGKYMIGDKKISAKVTNGKLLVRVGGGYVTMEEYMEQFGQSKLNRNERRNKREGRKKVGKKARALGYSGDTKIVGSADLMRSLQN